MKNKLKLGLKSYLGMLLFVAMVMLMVTPVTALAGNSVAPPTQGLNYVDLNNWTAHGDGIWNVEAGGRTVRQTKNGNPTFYLSPDEFIDKVITGTIKVNTASDDDMIGFVMGYQEPVSNYYDFTVFDWKQTEQIERGTSYDEIVKTSAEGYTLGTFTGYLNSTEYFGGLGSWSKYFWFHVPEEGKFNLLRTDYGPEKGWADFSEYPFKILYTSDRIKIMIEDQVVFNVYNDPGTFKVGKFGFYNSSQSEVIYGNVQSAPGTTTSAAPVAQDDRYGMAMNSTLSVDRFDGVLFNDYDPNLDSYSIELVSNVVYGALDLDLNTGAFNYTPEADFTGMDNFTYKLVETEGGAESEPVTVEINVIDGANQAPTAITLSNTLLEAEWPNDAVVGTLSTEDPNEGDIHDYMLINNAGGRFSIINDQIIINDNLSINSGEVYSITVRSTDFQGLYLDQTFSLEVPNTVTFEDYDGAILKTEIVTDGSGATAPADPIREGYTFTGWDTAFTNVTTNLTVTAQYAINQYTVTFNVYGGSAVSSQTVDYHTTATEPTVPTKTGYSFEGWYTDADFTTEFNFASAITADITLYAQWNQITAPTIQSVISGDTQVMISWNLVAGATGYKIFKSTAAGVYDSLEATVSAEAYSYDVTGLTNGTTYYFVVRTLIGNAESFYSNEMNATPQVAVPGAPVIQSAVAGDERVNLSWSPVIGSTGYKVYVSTVTSAYSEPAITVSGSVYSYELTGLTNGLTYYFVVKATNPGGDGPNSAEVSAVPRTVPGTPENVRAAAGHGQATVSFTAPVYNGGSPITGYVVTSNPGNITAAGTGTAITVKGLTNGISYTFTVQAINSVGTGLASAGSNSVTPYESSGAPTKPNETGVEILVNGQTETAATANTTILNDKTVITVIVDDQKIEEKLAAEGNNPTITIPVNNNAEVVVGQLNGQTVKNMETKEAVLEIKTGNVTYTLPASQINIEEVSAQLGTQVELKDITVNVTISAPPQETGKLVQDTANKYNYQVVVKPVDFAITCTSANQTVEVSSFNGYVERTLVIPDGVEQSKITTGIVLNNDGTFSHVPTTVTFIDGRYYAKINSLTNSSYSVIYNSLAFQDVTNHWAKDDINDMGSRLVVEGVGEGEFEPDRTTTRAEFGAILVKALGLMRTGTGQDTFKDVTKDAWYYDAVAIAYQYGIISGYGNGEFGPQDRVSREQAMTMIVRAMKITGLKVEFKAGEAEELLSELTDLGQSPGWAKENMAASVKAGIILGKSKKTLAPKDKMTRAETAVIVKRLLQKSNLI